MPAIVLLNDRGYRHFVVVKGLRNVRVLLGDPARGTRAMSRARFEALWDNRVLFVIHNRREIAWLLNLPDQTLRQRIVALTRKLRAAGLAMPAEFVGLNLDLAYGRIREALLPQLLRQGGIFASHDPDGHLFVVRRSQKD